MKRRHLGIRRRGALAATLAVAAIGSSAAIAAVAAAPAATAAPAAAKTGTGTVISAVDGPFGRMLVVGSGTYQGFTLYAITSDYSGHFGCTTKVQSILGHNGSCTGPSDDQNAEWPAITTTGSPVAGPGVSAKLLGSVYRKGVGHQVTYAGHPLYLFDNGPGEVTGEAWDEPSLPPWHGVWYVVSPSGRFQPWPGMLTTTVIGGHEVLAALMETGIGFEPFPVYSYSKDTRGSSACHGACARAWPPVLTSGQPGLAGGLRAGRLHVISRGDYLQVTYCGHPLYLFANEGIAPTATGYAATGSGNGLVVNGGTFSLVRV
jgi:predicted lipoprotein with Yx(FWY)xxD motif